METGRLIQPAPGRAVCLQGNCRSCAACTHTPRASNSTWGNAAKDLHLGIQLQVEKEQGKKVRKRRKTTHKEFRKNRGTMIQLSLVVNIMSFLPFLHLRPSADTVKRK